METLELKPLSKKKLNVLIIEKEYNEPFQLAEQTSTPPNPLFQPSIGFHNFIETIVSKVKIDFATEELGMRSKKEFTEANVAAKELSSSRHRKENGAKKRCTESSRHHI